MAIAMKRASASHARAREETVEDAAADLDRINQEQLANLREGWRELSLRAGRGMVLWHDREWEWEEPDWDADPETWPPLAKVLWVYVRMRLTEERLQYAAHGFGPAWCHVCNDDAEMPKGYHHSTCPGHSPLAGMVANFAEHLGLRVAS